MTKSQFAIKHAKKLGLKIIKIKLRGVKGKVIGYVRSGLR